ncbi:hypothetical protein BURMUCGD2M_4927 [Burkholderia multivorans CGD2M]|uniref:Uncharacterized protein n=1 Tax=Burkholderia multivorans CGD2 TaxID=513052 RepID=B9BIM8_9BURK|nr:hypothetical protein BURMUCGD2_4934 [Burkholderia multivorans CGD2]EEE15484.1 hypothetical protein BURMUCGD2M_4927 [Burkholderia multivorans CGD2M]
MSRIGHAGARRAVPHARGACPLVRARAATCGSDTQNQSLY